METIYILFIVFEALLIFVIMPAFIIPLTIINKRDKIRFQELQKNGKITSIRFKIRKIFRWTECGEIYTYDTYVRALGDTQIIVIFNEMEDTTEISTIISEINLRNLTTVEFVCVTENGGIYKQTIDSKISDHLELTFENGKTTVLF